MATDYITLKIYVHNVECNVTVILRCLHDDMLYLKQLLQLSLYIC